MDTPFRLRARYVPFLFLGIVVLLHLPGLFESRAFNNDEAYIATVVNVLSHGGDLYFDTVDRKPPGVFYIYLAVTEATGSTALWIPRLAAVLAHTLTAIGVWLLARRRFGDRPALVAGVLAAITSATVTIGDAQSAQFTVFMMPFVVGSMLLADQRKFTGAGLAVGLAGMMKQPALTTLLPLAWMAFRDRENRWRNLLLLGVGTLVPIAASALIFGPREFWFWVFGGANEGYLDVGGGLGVVVATAAEMSGYVIVLNLGLLALAAFAIRSWREDIDIWLWLLAAVIGVSSGTRFFGHYYWQLFPPLCLLAARGSMAIAAKWTRAAIALALFSAVAGMVVAWVGDVGGPGRNYIAVSEYIRANTDEGDRIFVWGHEPALFWASDRLPASRVVTTGFLTGHTPVRPPGHESMDRAIPGLWDQVMDDLHKHPPELILSSQPWDPEPGAAYPISKFPPMADFISENYVLVDEVNGLDVYRRIDAPE